MFSFKSGHQRCYVKKVVLKISQLSQENTFIGVSFLIKLQVFRKLQYRYFPVKFAKFWRTLILKNILEWLLLLLL